MDGFARILTHIVTVIFAGGSYLLLLAYLNDHNPAFLATIGTLSMIYAFGYCCTVSSYRLDEEILVLQRPLFRIKIARTDIVRTRLVAPEEIHLFKLMGVYGLFGYTGIYYSRESGRVNMYGRKIDGAKLAIELTDGRIFILTPDDPGSLFSAL